MGMFDSVNVTCRQCGETVEFQSKAGDCDLNVYDISAVPVEIAHDLRGEEEGCRCGNVIELTCPYLPSVVGMGVAGEY